MWDLGNRGIIVLISVTSGCAILYNTWGPVLALTLSIALVVYLSYSLLVNDSILSPHALHLVKFIRLAGREINDNLETAYHHLLRDARKLPNILETLKTLYQVYVAPRMSRFRKNTYQLSNDSYDSSRNVSRFNITGQLSPIPRSEYHRSSHGADSNGAENHRYDHPNAGRNLDASHVVPKRTTTSTPIVPWRKEADPTSNGTLGLFTPGRSPRQKSQPMYSQSHTLSRGKDTLYSPEGSPWGTSISPKMRSKAGGIKTVQTVAGPLLASTRYNIDSKVYSDVTSPGLSTRLAKYATDANNKLTHQSQYATGQFPKVNLSANPVPLLNTKTTKVRTPVTVRIAPPEATRYSPPERQKILSEVCRAENKTAPTVVQVLREISLKRHASREDVSVDLVKKQRTDSLYNIDNLDELEEMTQKRAREDSPKSEEDTSPKSRTLRPTKRTKTPSCYDVLNSLSSSIHVPSGVKRKASTLDLSRCGTPDPEKHFKPSDNVQTAVQLSLAVFPQQQTDVLRAQKCDLNEKSSQNTDVVRPYKKLQEQATTKGILKSPPNKELVINQNVDQSHQKHITDNVTQGTVQESMLVSKPVKLIDKLFMRAEPESNERLRTMIQEQGNIRAKFTTDDTEEIKKEDIVNMRQTSMRARLQSMFDAISGKAASKINPDVVIQAEEPTEPTATADTPTSLATLSSTTSTTHVNTSPIATSAVAPTSTESKPNTTPAKRVTFNLPASQSSQSSDGSSTKSISGTGFKGDSDVPDKPEAPKLNFPSSVTSSAESVAISSSSSTFDTPKSTIASTTYSFGTPKTTSNLSNMTSALPNTGLSFGAPSAGTAVTSSTSLAAQNLKAPTSTVANTPSLALNSTFTSSNSSPAVDNVMSSKLTTVTIPISSAASSFGAGPVKLAFESTNSSQSLMPSTQASSKPAPNFSFGAAKVSTPPAFGNNHTLSTPAINSPATGSISFGVPAASTTTSSFGSSSNLTLSTPTFNASSTTSSSTPAMSASPMFAFGSNTTTAPQTSKPGGFSFGSKGNTNQNTSTFGSTTVPTVQNVPTATNANTTSTTNSAFLFGTSIPSTTARPGFGTTANSTTTSSGFASSGAPPSFSFGGATSASKPGFSFGANATSAVASTAAPTPNFGTASGNTLPAFGTPSTTAAQPFGATTTQSTFGSTTPAPAFGSTNTNPPSFGATTNTGASSAFGTPKTTAPPAFGSNTNNPAFGGAITTTHSLFGGLSSNANTNTTASTTFGTSASIFGQTKSPPAFGSATPAFGSTNTPSFGAQSSAPPAFGATNAVTSPVTTGFGTVNSTTPAFGAPNTTTASSGTQNSSASAFGSSNSAFGVATSAPPAFGATTSTTSGFGSSATSAFGAQNSGTPTFGAANNNASNFGGNAASPFGAQNSTPSFGTPSSTAPAFGATNSNANSTFTFGSNQPQSQQNSSFSFGGSNTSNNNAPAASGSSSFGFGAAPAKPAGGFNFNAPSASPSMNFGGSATPSFGAQTPGANMFSATGTPSPAPAGGMFSIGAGSTAPRSRSTRTRRQR